MQLNYEMLLRESDSHNLIIKEKPLIYNDGRIKGNRIAIRKSIDTSTEKACVLAEELGHFHTTVGDILDQSKTENRKQEIRARAWAYDRLVNLHGIIKAYENKCSSFHEMAEFLDVTEDFLTEALDFYKGKYGISAVIDNYVIYFEPCLGVLKMV